MKDTPCIGFAGGVFMCRRNVVWGNMLLAFGVGLLLGQCMESGILGSLIGILAIAAGICTLGKK